MLNRYSRMFKYRLQRLLEYKPGKARADRNIILRSHMKNPYAMKKQIVLWFAALSVAVSALLSPAFRAGAESVELWSGSAELPADWSGKGVKIEASALEGLARGDKLVMSLSGILQESGKWPQLYIMQGNGSAFSPKIVIQLSGKPAATDIEFTVEDYVSKTETLSAEDFIAGASTNGLLLKGMGYTLEKVVLQKADSGEEEELPTVSVEVSTTLWNGVQTVEGWSGAQQFSAAACSEIKAGDRIVVTCTQALSETQSQVDLRNGDGWANFTPALNIDLTGATFPYEAVFTVTEEVAGIIHANGMVVTGKDFVFTKVAFVTNKEMVESSHKGNFSRTVWEGEEAISWTSGSSNSVLIDKQALGKLKAGNVVRVYYTDMKPGGVGRILANWTALESLSNKTLLGSRYYEYTLTENWITQIESSTGLRLSGNNYTATKVEIIDPAKKFYIQGEPDMRDIKAWEAGEQPKISLGLTNIETVGVDVDVEVDVDTDMYADYCEKEQTVTLAAGESRQVEIPFDLEAGFYNLNVYVNGDNVCSYVIGCRPSEVVSPAASNLSEIKEYWDNELEILAEIPIDAELTLIESASTENRNVYLVKMKSTPDTYGGEPVEIRGFYAEPVKEGKYPALIQYQGTDGGTSTITPIGGDDNIGWCELVLSTRGQMLNNRAPESCEWAWLDPAYTRSDKGSVDYYAHGFGDKEKHYYRGGNIDCIRAIDFIESRDKVSKSNIFAVGGSQGGSFVYVAAALGNGRIRAAAPSITGHSDFADCVRIVSWPGNVFSSKQQELGMTDDEMWHFLSFYDVKNLAPMVNCPIITSFSLQDRTDPPHINVAPLNNVNRDGLDDDDLQYVVNSFLGHGTAADWKSRYMTFFDKYRTDLDPVDPSAPVTEVWSGSETIDWNAGETNNWVSIPASQFRNAEAGCILRMCFSGLSMGAQGHVCRGNWSDLADAAEYLQLTGSSFSFEITEPMLAQLKADGLIVTGVGYTLETVEIVNPANLPDVDVNPVESHVCVWNKGENVKCGLVVANRENRDVSVDLSLTLRRDNYEPMPSQSRTVTIAAGETVTESFSVDELAPGFYHAVLTANHREVADYNFGYDVEGIESAPDRQPDFDDFWAQALDELAGVDMEASLTLIEEKSTRARNVYLVEMKSISDDGTDPVVIRGYYAEPVAEGKYPAIITYQGYDSDPSAEPWCPGGDDLPGYVELFVSTRGQMLNNREPNKNVYGDWFVYELGNRDSYYYRGAYMDAVRAIDFVASRAKTDKENIFAQGQSQGGALTIAAAALGGGRLKAIAPSIPFMGDFPDYFRIGNWPSYNVSRKQAELSLSDEDLYKSLSYFDTKNLAPAIECPVRMVFGLQDNVCPPHTNMAPYNNLASQTKELSYNSRLAHQTHSGWYGEYMKFFGSFLSSAGINTLTESTPAKTLVYNIEGVLVAEDDIAAGKLTSGIYIIKRGIHTEKVLVR